ncbi:MAG: hypothetical protein WD766_10465 [Gemmatimonadota bacterium]
MKHAIRSYVAAVVLPLALGGCSTATTGTDGPQVGSAGRATTVVVENQSTSDMRIYVSASGLQVRLGSVTSLNTSRLEIPSSIVGTGRELRFVADPLAGTATAASYSIFVEEGEEVHMTIPPNIR